MKAVTRYFAGAAAAAAMMAGAAAPAQAQSWDRYRDRGGIDAGDIIAGVAVLGGIAAIVSALDRDTNRYGHDNRYRYRDDYRGAVNACAHEAQRLARGANVRITDVDQRGSNRYRVEGVIDARSGYANQWRGNRFDQYGRHASRVGFECTAYGNGRITGFATGRA